MAKAMIALSGGVDSSVAAHLMQQEGETCIGGTMRLFPGSLCSSEQNIKDAQAVAQRLDIPFHVFDFSEAFSDKVIGKFVQCYESGTTPNPCVDCNRYLKFGSLLESARQLGCDYVVTGHYAQIQQDPTTGRYLLRKAKDEAKDQSYFLYALTQDQAAHIRFPLGSLEKQQVRQIAEENGFLTARKKDSQDICFIPDGDYLAFLQRYTGKQYTTGDFLDICGNIVGKHKGAVGYTLGQRKGLGLAMGQPVYVCSKNMENNTVTIGSEDALFHSALRATDWNWFPFPTLTQPLRVMAKTRSRQKEQLAWVYPEENGAARVEFDQPQRAMTPGQAVVLYQEDLVVGGGTITEIL